MAGDLGARYPGGKVYLVEIQGEGGSLDMEHLVTYLHIPDAEMTLNCSTQALAQTQGQTEPEMALNSHVCGAGCCWALLFSGDAQLKLSSRDRMGMGWGWGC